MLRNLPYTLVLVLSVIVSAQGNAQRVRDAGRDIRHALGDVTHFVSSPFRADAKDWATFGGIAAATGLVALADSRIDAWFVRQDDKGNLRPLDFFREDRDDKFPLSEIAAAKWLMPAVGAVWLVGAA